MRHSRISEERKGDKKDPKAGAQIDQKKKHGTDSSVEVGGAGNQAEVNSEAERENFPRAGGQCGSPEEDVPRRRIFEKNPN